MTQWIDVAAIDDIEDGVPLAAEANGTPIALFRVEDEFFALYDLCSHGAARLSDGFVEDKCVECPLHQGLIDLASGEPRSAPITEPVKSYPTRVVGDRIEVAL